MFKLCPCSASIKTSSRSAHLLCVLGGCTKDFELVVEARFSNAQLIKLVQYINWLQKYEMWPGWISFQCVSSSTLWTLYPLLHKQAQLRALKLPTLSQKSFKWHLEKLTTITYYTRFEQKVNSLKLTFIPFVWKSR